MRFSGPLFCLVMIVACCMAQKSAASDSPAQGTVANGAVDPTAISDREAIHILLLVLANSDENGFLRVRIAHIGLSHADEDVVTTAVHAFRDKLQPLRAQAEALRDPVSNSNSEGANYVDVAQAMQSVSEASFATLVGQITPQGRTALRNYLRYIKKKMKVIQSPASMN